MIYSAIKDHLEKLWEEQIQKELKGKIFEETLQSDYEGIKINPLYTKENLPPKIPHEATEFLEDSDFVESTQEDGGKILTWNICEQMYYRENNLNADVIESVQRGCNFISIHAENWNPFFKEIRSLQYPASFSLQIESDLTEENIVPFWREHIGFIGSRDLLIHALEFDPISFWLKHGFPENENKTWNNFAQLYLRIAGHLQDCKLLKIDVTHFSEKNVSDQLAFALAIASDYLHQLQSKEIVLEELMHLITFKFCIGTNYFLEIAKLQAFKILWNNLMMAYIPDLDFIPNPYLHAIIASKSTTEEIQYDGLIHQTTQAMSAILGGCDTLQIEISNPTLHALHNASTHIQNILRYESNLDMYRNAAHGSFYVESLTNQLAEKAWEKFQQIETDGGFIMSWKNGKMK